MKLYTYFRSSAAYRVRIALNLKGLPYDSVPVHLVKDGGQQLQASYQAKNPQKLIPALELEDGTVLTQSLAIMEYLDEAHPAAAALLPQGTIARAQVRALAQAIACDIHPLNNLRVLKYLSGTLQVSDEVKNAWYQHWVQAGFSAIETMLANSPDTGKCCFGDTPTLADCCLIPQVYNAERFNVDMAAYPTIARITAHCRSLPAFQQAAPEQQADAA